MPSILGLKCIFLLLLLQLFRIDPISMQQQFFETFTDFKKNHIDDELHYSFHYYIDQPDKNLQLSHREERHGPHVMGQYGVLEPDGLVRQVYYEADGAQGEGFRAVIKTYTAASRVRQLLHLPGRQQPDAPVHYQNPVAFVL